MKCLQTQDRAYIFIYNGKSIRIMELKVWYYYKICVYSKHCYILHLNISTLIFLNINKSV